MASACTPAPFWQHRKDEDSCGLAWPPRTGFEQTANAADSKE